MKRRKKLKRLSTLGLAAVMILSLVGFPAYAQGTGTAVGDLTVDGDSGWTHENIDGVTLISITESGSDIIAGDGSDDVYSGYRIEIEEKLEVELTLRDVKISNSGSSPLSIDGTARVTLILEGNNIFTSTGRTYAGIEFSDATSGSLTITSESGDGSLTAEGGYRAAGIGGGDGGSGSYITISGGTVIATGGSYGAGIGGGDGGSGSYITISGGTVIATGGSTYGAGIGGGNDGSGSYITISGGTVTAEGGYNAAGIGGGNDGPGNNVTISGGDVTAKGGYNAAGIGGGDDGSGSDITIEGGAVSASGGSGGAGIGGGNDGSGNNITISGGDVTAKGGYFGAGIGGGEGGSGSYITISGEVVTATGGWRGSGIGGGYSGSGNNITISGGTVTATGTSAADIGGGYNASGSDITISNGSVKATDKWISITPVNEEGNYVYLLEIPDMDDINEVLVDGENNYIRNGDHPDDGTFYIYLTGKDHIFVADGVSYFAEWQEKSESFLIKNFVPAPTVSISGITASSITVESLPDTYGDAEYMLVETATGQTIADWQASNEFTDLCSETEYTVYARYKGNDYYVQSKAGYTTVTTMEDESITQNPDDDDDPIDDDPVIDDDPTDDDPVIDDDPTDDDPVIDDDPIDDDPVIDDDPIDDDPVIDDDPTDDDPVVDDDPTDGDPVIDDDPTDDDPGIDDDPVIDDDSTDDNAAPSESVDDTDDNVTSSENGDDTDAPQTGDNSNIALWIGIMLAAGAALTSSLVYLKRR